MEISKDTKKDEILKLAPACKCEKCSHGCEFGSGLLVESDLPKIAEFLGIDERKLKEDFLEEVEIFNKKGFKPRLLRKDGKPYGKCIFYDDGCKIHPVKPLQCKTSMGCKDYGDKLTTWFYLNYFVDVNDEESMKQWENYMKVNRKI